MIDPDEVMQAHRLTPDGSLFSPSTLQEVRDRLEYIDAYECDCGETPHEDALHDLAHDDVPALLRVIEHQAAENERLQAELLAERTTEADQIVRLRATIGRVREVADDFRVHDGARTEVEAAQDEVARATLAALEAQT